MSRNLDLLWTALAPALWGSSYIVTTELLPNMDPLSVSVLRALPAGLLLLLIVRQLPSGSLIAKMFLLGALNFSIFWSLLFFAAYRLPGGVAAVLGALQPFIVVFAARAFLNTPIKLFSVLAALSGVVGVALLILTPEAKLDMLGIIAGFCASLSMAIGTVLSRKWHPPVSSLTFTAWQLTAGGILLLPLAFFAETDWSQISPMNILALSYLGLVGAAMTYILWLRGIARLSPIAVSILGFLSPLTATLLGWLLLNETLSWMQGLGVCIILGSIFAGQYALSSKDGKIK